MNYSEIMTDVPTDTSKSLSDFQAGTAKVVVFGSVPESAVAAPRDGAELITKAVSEKGCARVIAATGNSQIALIVVLDDACKRQQAGQGHCANAASVPAEAITIKCPGLFRAKAWITVVPDQRKAAAVKAILEGPITTECPGSIIHTHPNATVYLERSSASLLNIR